MTTRRDVIVGALGGLVAAHGARGAAAAAAASSGDGHLVRHTLRPPNYETPIAALAPQLTPNDSFFVRYHLSAIPVIDPASWRLAVHGTSARDSLSLSLHDLKTQFESVELAAVNQCAGNRRALFSPRVPGVQWESGAVGNALWQGVRLRDVLQKAGLSPEALEIWFAGADSGVLPATPRFEKSLPVERALDDSVLIAYGMNRAPLPHEHGAPARLIVPGWVGTYWLKHLTEIRPEPTPLPSFWMKTAYRVPTGAFPGYQFKSQETAETTPVTQLLVNSLVTSPATGTRLVRGRHAQLAGKAWDGGAGIRTVEVSTDSRKSWKPAVLGRDPGRYAWREFTAPLDTSRSGTLDVAVRAVSVDGSRQPDELTPNPSGYHNNIVQTLRLEVS